MLLVAPLCALLAACGPGVELPPLEPVPHPELAAGDGAVEDAVRHQVEAARERVEEAEATAEELHEVAAAYGELAETYHAYELHRAAAVAYANAAVLDPRNPAWPYAHGLLERDRGDFARAAELFARALELRPTLDRARLRRADALLESGDATAARQSVGPLAEDPPDDLAPVVHWIRGRVAASLGEDEAAVQALEAVLDRQPAADVVRRPLAQALLRLGQEEAARRHLEQLASLGDASPGQVRFPDPQMERIHTLAQSAGSYLRRGNRALVTGRVDQAAELFRRGLEIDPDHLELRLNLGLALVRAERPDAALETLREAVERHPESAQAHHDLGTVLRAHLRHGDAVASFERAVELRPDYAEAWFNLANALAGAERWAEAEEALLRHRELQPDDTRTLYLLAMAHHEQGRSAEAIVELRELLGQDPADPQLRRGLAQILDRTGRSDEAMEVWMGAAELRPPPDEAGEFLDAAARIAWRKGDRQQAIRIWRRWTEIEPGSSPAHTALANALQLAGRRAAAVREFRRAVELDPQNATAWLSETRLLTVRGEYAAAKNRLEDAVALHPENPGLLDTLARVLATAPDPALRDGERAFELARRAYGLSGSLEHGETVAMALAELGRYDQAIQALDPLAMQARQAGDRAALARMASQLRTYQQRRPLRAPGGPR